MSLPVLTVVGQRRFLARHSGLLDALDGSALRVRPLPLESVDRFRPVHAVTGLAHLGMRTIDRSGRADYVFEKNAGAFRGRTRLAVRGLDAPAHRCDAVLQVFGMFRSFHYVPTRPVFLLLDYTLLLAEQRWPAWAWFPTRRAREGYLDLERENYRSATHVFAMSALVQRSLVHDYGVDPARITVIGSAPATSIERPSCRPARPGAGPVLLCNGSDFYRKGADVAVAMMSRVRRTLPTTVLRIVGNRLPLRHPAVQNLGRVDAREMSRLLHDADLVVAPARCDPFPTFLVEAQRFGVPVVASNRDGVPEIVIDGVTGSLVDDLSPESFGDRVVALLTDPAARAAAGVAAEQRAERFDWSLIASAVRAPILHALTNGTAGAA